MIAYSTHLYTTSEIFRIGIVLDIIGIAVLGVSRRLGLDIEKAEEGVAWFGSGSSWGLYDDLLPV